PASCAATVASARCAARASCSGPRRGATPRSFIHDGRRLMTAYGKPLPRITPDNRPFWDATRRHELALQRCAECRRFRYPPAPVCTECLSERVEWLAVSGRGTVSNFVVVHHRYFPSLAANLASNLPQLPLAQG